MRDGPEDEEASVGQTRRKVIGHSVWHRNWRVVVQTENKLVVWLIPDEGECVRAAGLHWAEIFKGQSRLVIAL